MEDIVGLNVQGLSTYTTLEEDEELSVPRIEGDKFYNPWDSWVKPPLAKGLKFMAQSLFKGPKLPRSHVLDEILPVIRPNFDLINNPDPEKITSTWIGHSSFLIQMDGLSFLTDPVFSNRASPFSFIGPKRYRPLPLTLEELPPIDFIVVSHNHYDHLDISVVKHFKNSVGWVIPKKLGKWFTEQGVTNFVELDWWEKCDIHDNISVAGVPAQHWSKRTMGDDMETLWGGYAIMGKNKKVYFAGDTGYNDIAFKEIGEKFGPFDLSLIPIGAYDPREFLSPQHIGPDEAVQIHLDIKSKKSIGIHWGTFILTNEPITEPRELLNEELIKNDLDTDCFVTMRHGDTMIVE